MRRNTLTILLLLLLGCGYSLSNPTYAQSTPAPALVLRQKIDHILDAPALSTGFQGIFIQSVKDQKILYTRNAERVFLPASNNKLLTGSAALALLGPDFRYKTEAYATGQIQTDGTLTGDLILKGYGDPTLTYDDLKDMAEQIKQAGILAIQGKIYYDDTRFDDLRLGEGWNWDDEPFAYSAQISALNVNANTIQIIVQTGTKPGEPVKVSTLPECNNYLTLLSTAVTGPPGSRTTVNVERMRGGNTVRIDGMIASDAPIYTTTLTVDNPAKLTAILFSQCLQQSGTHLDRTRITPLEKQPALSKIIATHSSAPLSQLLSKMNKPSDNLIAECLLKTVGTTRKPVGSAGYNGTGPTAARDWFASIGMNLNQLHQVDGSGLSRQDYVSPQNLVTLLRYWAGNPQFPTLYESLPIAGLDGTLRNRMKDTAAASNCHAKTGSLGHVSCLSGYVTTRDGVLIAFSLLFNNHLGPMSACLSAENQIVILLAESTLSPISASPKSTINTASPFVSSQVSASKRLDQPHVDQKGGAN